jgi:hypothetical protein
MKKYLSEVVTTYVEKDPEWLEQVKGTGKTYKKVGADFFGDAPAKWDEKWSEKSAYLSKMREVAKSTSEE